jgi:hypothetical protein
MLFPVKLMAPASGKCQSPTVRDVCDIYLRGHIKNRAEKGRVEIRRTFDLMLAGIADHDAATVTRKVASVHISDSTTSQCRWRCCKELRAAWNTTRIPVIFRRPRQMGGVRRSAANSSPKSARSWSMSRKGNCWDHAPTESLWVSPMKFEANWHAGQSKQAA